LRRIVGWGVSSDKGGGGGDYSSFNPVVGVERFIFEVIAPEGGERQVLPRGHW
jgi:hypothetical protein